MLTLIYRLLSKFKKQDELAQDMHGTFEEARAAALAGGWWSYLTFAAREIAGLFDFPTATSWWLRAAAWGGVGLGLGWLASELMPAKYTSEANLRLAPSVVSQDLLPRDSFSVDSVLEAETPVVLSRTVITDIVTRFNLYPEMRARLPIEEIADEFRKSTRIERAGSNVIRVAFTYSDWPLVRSDRYSAQKVVMELVSQMMDRFIRQRSSLMYLSLQFFVERAEKLGNDWSKLNQTVQATPLSSPQYALLALTRDQKRKDLESAQQKRGEAEALLELESRKQDKTLELLDPATLPEQADTSPIAIRLIGLAGGLSLWLLAELWRALRRGPMDLPASRATESA